MASLSCHHPIYTTDLSALRFPDHFHVTKRTLQCAAQDSESLQILTCPQSSKVSAVSSNLTISTTTLVNAAVSFHPPDLSITVILS